MSAYEDAASRPGIKGADGTDDRELFLTEFGGMVLEAWIENSDYEGMSYVRNITQGKADTFPVIGRKRDATEHEPGQIILGGTVEHNEVEITLDKMLVDAAFVPEVDELMAHYEIARPYARQLGESLATTNSRRIATQHILASRVETPPYTGGPLPGYYYHSAVATNPAMLEAATFSAIQHIKENDIGGGNLGCMLPWQQYLLLARYAGFQGGAPASAVATFHLGGRRTGQAEPIGGIAIRASNHIPHTEITTGLAKYQGDFTECIGHISNMMAVGTLNRRGMKVVMKEQEDRLGTLLIASRFNGHGVLRPECSFEITDTQRSGWPGGEFTTA